MERLHGVDAYVTAATVAHTPGRVVGPTQQHGRTAVVASGEDVPDALAATALVYGQHLPLVFARHDALLDVTASALAALGIRTVILLGRPAAVSPAVGAQLARTVRVVPVWVLIAS